MKRITTALLITAASLGVASCEKETIGEGPVSTQTRPMQNFTVIDLRMNGNVFYIKSTETKIVVTAKESIHSMLQTVVLNNRLQIAYRDGSTYDHDPSIRIEVYAPNVSSFVLNTSGNITSLSDVAVPHLLLRSTGSGSILLQGLTIGSMEAESLQSGRIIAGTGTAISEKLKTGGSGRIDLSGISANSVSARTMGSGDIKVKVYEELDATIDGSGSIFFHGYPRLSTHISGTGYIIRF